MSLALSLSALGPWRGHRTTPCRPVPGANVRTRPLVGSSALDGSVDFNGAAPGRRSHHLGPLPGDVLGPAPAMPANVCAGRWNAVRPLAVGVRIQGLGLVDADDKQSRVATYPAAPASCCKPARGSEPKQASQNDGQEAVRLSRLQY